VLDQYYYEFFLICHKHHQNKQFIS